MLIYFIHIVLYTNIKLYTGYIRNLRAYQGSESADRLAQGGTVKKRRNGC